MLEQEQTHPHGSWRIKQNTVSSKRTLSRTEAFRKVLIFLLEQDMVVSFCPFALSPSVIKMLACYSSVHSLSEFIIAVVDCW